MLGKILSSLHPQLPGKHWGIAELLRSQPGFAHMFEVPSICSTHAEDPSVVDHPARAAPLMKAPLSSHQAVRVAPLLKALDDLLRLRLLSLVASHPRRSLPVRPP
jgi:hypothetical protein